MGELEHITARHGQALQIRPKAVNARSLCRGISRDGEKSLTLPRGFYLRTAFTTNIIRQAGIT